eukprot:NODE_2640_length_889_cov_126.896429_g2173_i0.p3 GENE.NODE_2640_length_889_cov_126.896429_g2173_i0~~NODE_2640_length_889_cov_126.896429_g2173_i0.p3  ORF type:complete len:70 (+),score=19.34 NODE_2640_length_889_cov_126.896429_g2173_i0:539-748(+)
MDEFCNTHGFVTWFETSARDGNGVEEACNFLVSKVMEFDPALPIDSRPVNPNPFRLDDGPVVRKKECCS